MTYLQKPEDRNFIKVDSKPEGLKAKIDAKPLGSNAEVDARPEGSKAEVDAKPEGSKAGGWFNINIDNFRNKLKKFGGDFMTFLARSQSEDIKPEDIPYMGCYIQSIDQLGKVVLKFNITLIPELIYSEDLKRLLNFEITPEDDGSDEMDKQSNKYNFDWGIISFNKEESTIDI